MTRKEIEKKVVRILESELDMKHIKLDDTFGCLHLDSLDRDCVASRCESEFDIAERQAVWDGFWNESVKVSELCDFVEKRM